MAVDSERILQDKVIHWLEELGYKYLGNLMNEDNTPIKADLLERNLQRRGYSDNVIKIAVQELVSKAANQTDTLLEVNREIYSLLRYGRQGIKNSARQRITVNYIDWKNISTNDFYIAEEVSVLCRDGIHRKRPDLVFYINGIALGICELKNSAVSTSEGIRQILTNQKTENISRFFSTVQLLLAGNESQGIFYGTTRTPEKYYLQWRENKNATDSLSITIKKLRGKNNSRLRADIISLCHKERFLSLIYEFIIFDGMIKKIARHNQYFAIKAAEKKIAAYFEGTSSEQGGIIWNTQGSGKSLIMVWLTKWIMENISDSRVVIVTDREELDDQIESVFINVNENIRRAKSCADLRDILNRHENNIICSLIHKYGFKSGEDADIDLYVQELLKNLPKNFCAKGNIITFIDECHRTNSGKLHKAVKILMPDAFIIGFTGTPILKSDKATSREIFGNFIHTYKFNEGVADGTILDLLYEPRYVEQNLTSPKKIDLWFNEKTEGLTEQAKNQLKKRWATLKNLYSSKQRLEKIAADIILDMDLKPRLKSERGTAMLVAGSIYEAFRFWEIFHSQGFTKCAVVTSYEPTASNVRTATTDLDRESEDEYKNRICKCMLNGKKASEFEKQVKEAFKKQPAEMKLLIVVDKLLTGFDAPSATYIYIDKKMRDHELFQAICRVNRPDGEDKDFGYIIDYKDLFSSVQLAIADYTTEAFNAYDKADIEGLIKNRYDEAKAQMELNFKALKELFSNIPYPQNDSNIIAYFCDSTTDEQKNKRKADRRNIFYSMTTALTRGFMNCCDRLVSHYSYSKKDIDTLRQEVKTYNKIKEMIKLASCDYIDLKLYESDMRYILDTYVSANDAELFSNLGEITLTKLLIENTTTTAESLHNLTSDNSVSAEIIENNLIHEIKIRLDSNRIYYEKMSAMLRALIAKRKAEKISYEEYLHQVIELTQTIFQPEKTESYPLEIRDSEARRALYDYFDNAELAIKIDESVKDSCEPDWKDNRQKQKKILLAIFEVLKSHGYSKEDAEKKSTKLLETIIKNQKAYDI